MGPERLVTFAGHLQPAGSFAEIIGTPAGDALEALHQTRMDQAGSDYDRIMERRQHMIDAGELVLRVDGSVGLPSES